MVDLANKVTKAIMAELTRAGIFSECEKGQRSDLTGCTPQSGEASGGGGKGKPESKPSLPGVDSGKWAKSLSRAEAFDVKQYTSEAKVSRALNKALREGNLDSSQKKIAKSLDSAISKAGKSEKPFRVYRGVDLPANVLNKIKESVEKNGKSRISLPDFQSTSLDPDVARRSSLVKSPANTGRAIFVIETDQGMPAFEVSPNKSEREVILGRGWTYEATAVGKDDKTGAAIVGLRLVKGSL